MATLFGSFGRDTITGGAQADSIFGLAGDDVLSGLDESGIITDFVVGNPTEVI